MTEAIQEFFDSRGIAVHVDRPSAVIRGVKVLGLESRNGRSYLPEALAAAAPLYEEVKVNVNHPKGNAAGPRDYQDRIGVIRNVSLRPGEGLFADFHFNPKHALAEQLIWDAEHAPENVGFSHNVEARTTRCGDRLAVEAITRVQSVDLVADPATTRGLFESASDIRAENSACAAGEPLTVEILERDYPELVERLRGQSAAEVARLREEVARLTADQTRREKEDAARGVLRALHLPDPGADDPLARTITSDAFFESLVACPDDNAMRQLAEERRALVQALTGDGQHHASAEVGPQSRDQWPAVAASPDDAKRFVNSIT